MIFCRRQKTRCHGRLFASQTTESDQMQFLLCKSTGALAQLGERLICIQEVRSSILLGSTKTNLRFDRKALVAVFYRPIGRRVSSETPFTSYREIQNQHCLIPPSVVVISARFCPRAEGAQSGVSSLDYVVSLLKRTELSKSSTLTRFSDS